MEDQPPKRVLKRARAVQSCINCRSKKLKCDRQTPCVTCVKGGIGSSCTYDATIGSMSKAHQESTPKYPDFRNNTTNDRENTTYEAPKRSSRVRRLGVIERLEARIQHLERTVYVGDAPKPYLDESDGSRQEDDNFEGAQHFENDMSTAVESSNSLEHSKRAVDIDHFADAKPYIVEKLTNKETFSLLSSLRAHFPKRRMRFEEPHISREQIPRLILDLLPQRAECATHINFYINTIGHFYPIFDSTSLQNYFQNVYWLQTLQERVDDVFTLCLLLVAIIARGSDISSTAESIGIKLSGYNLAYKWLFGVQGKPALDIGILQAKSLFVLAMQMATHAETNDIWLMSGSLVRTAILAGLPKPSSSLTHSSSFERSSLWLAIVELDLQLSLSRALPSAISRADMSIKGGMVDSPKAISKMLESSLLLRLSSARYHADFCANSERILQKLSILRNQQNEVEAGYAQSSNRVIFHSYINRSIISLSKTYIVRGRGTMVHEMVVRSSIDVLLHLRHLSASEWGLVMRLCGHDIFAALQLICFIARGSVLELDDFGDYRQLGLVWDKRSLIRLAENAFYLVIENMDVTAIGNHIKDMFSLAVIIGGTRCDNLPSKLGMDAAFSKLVEKLYERAQSMRTPISDENTPTLTLNSIDPDMWFSSMNNTFEYMLGLDPNSFSFDSDAQWSPIA